MTLRVVGVPCPQGSLRAWLPRGSRRPMLTSDNPNLRQWRQLVAHAAAGAQGRDALLEGPVQLDVCFYLPRPKSRPRALPAVRPDLDKLLRAVQDALSGVIYRDDAQVVTVIAQKRYAGAEPVGAVLRVEGVEDVECRRGVEGAP